MGWLSLGTPRHCKQFKVAEGAEGQDAGAEGLDKISSNSGYPVVLEQSLGALTALSGSIHVLTAPRSSQEWGSQCTPWMLSMPVASAGSREAEQCPGLDGAGSSVVGETPRAVGEHQPRGAGGASRCLGAALAAGRREAKPPSHRAAGRRWAPPGTSQPLPARLAAPPPPHFSPVSQWRWRGGQGAAACSLLPCCRRRTRAVRGAGKSGQCRAGRDGCLQPSPAKPAARRRHRPGEEGDRRWDFLLRLSPGEKQHRGSWAGT